MAEAGLIGHLTSEDDKKRKDGSARPLMIPFTSPSYHLLVGGAESRHEEVLGATITNALLVGTNIVAFDTSGMIVPFLLPFLPGEHVKKVRGFKERVPQGLVENMRPAGVFFNSPVEEAAGNAIKGWFSLPKILLDAARLTPSQQDALQNAFGISKRVLMKDVLQSLVAVATGKDYTKVMARATAFVEYMLTGFEQLADRGLPFPTWVHARDALFKGDSSIPKPAGLNGGDIDLFAQTLDYYITNAMLFKPPRPGPAAMDLEHMARVNFLVFYLQDMNEREQALAIALIVAQHAIATVMKPEDPVDPISIIMRQGNTCLAFDELGIIARKGQPAMQPLASTISLLREAAARGLSLLMATWSPSAVDLELVETDVLGPSKAGVVETNLYIGKLKEKEGLAGIASWLGSKGASIAPAQLASLKPMQGVLVPLQAPGEAVRFDMLESGVMSIAVTPALLKSMLATPILVSKKAGPPAIAPSPVKTPSQVKLPSSKPAPVVEVPRSTASPPVLPTAASRSPPAQATRVEARLETDFLAPEPSATPSPADQPRPLARPELAPAPVPTRATAPVVASMPAIVMQRPVTIDEHPASSPEPPGHELTAPVVEDLLDRYEPEGDDADEGIAGTNGDEPGDMSTDIDFLSRLLGAERDTTAEGKISRFDYNMALNALLFKLEKIVKASFGVQFFKELMSAKSMSYDRAREMYYEESNAMLKGKFAVQKGDTIAYQGIKEAVRAIIGELGLRIPLPPTEDLERLEAALLKALDLPRGDLLKRIKDGSLYF